MRRCAATTRPAAGLQPTPETTSSTASTRLPRHGSNGRSEFDWHGAKEAKQVMPRSRQVSRQFKSVVFDLAIGQQSSFGGPALAQSTAWRPGIDGPHVASWDRPLPRPVGSQTARIRRGI